MSQRWWGESRDPAYHATTESCTKEALTAGAKSAAVGGAVSSAVVMTACKLFPAFNCKLSVSSRTALIVMPPFFLFALKSELTMNACARRNAMARQSVA